MSRKAVRTTRLPARPEIALPALVSAFHPHHAHRRPRRFPDASTSTPIGEPGAQPTCTAIAASPRQGGHTRLNACNALNAGQEILNGRGVPPFLAAQILREPGAGSRQVYAAHLALLGVIPLPDPPSVALVSASFGCPRGHGEARCGPGCGLVARVSVILPLIAEPAVSWLKPTRRRSNPESASRSTTARCSHDSSPPRTRRARVCPATPFPSRSRH
jgi:hypothetical protein